MADGFVLEIPEMVGIPLAAKRTAQKAAKAWPAGTVIVSADSHMIERDCWYDQFPKKLKSKAPRIEFKDGGYHFSLGKTPMLPVELVIGTQDQVAFLAADSQLRIRLEPELIKAVETQLGAGMVRLVGGVAFDKTEKKPWENKGRRGGGD